MERSGRGKEQVKIACPKTMENYGQNVQNTNILDEKKLRFNENLCIMHSKESENTCCDIHMEVLQHPPFAPNQLFLTYHQEREVK
jgi:hypothetical protein